MWSQTFAAPPMLDDHRRVCNQRLRFFCLPEQSLFFFFFLNDTAPPEISTLPLPDALPIFPAVTDRFGIGDKRLARLEDIRGAFLELPKALRLLRNKDRPPHAERRFLPGRDQRSLDRKSTRLNSSHDQISYAVFCLKKKKNI